MHLLISLGTSWPIVPEAFFHPGRPFCEVHVLTSSADEVTSGIARIRDWFSVHSPGVMVTVTRLQDVPNITGSDDHEAFEEGLFRWVVHRRRVARAQGAKVEFCLAGGYKTMSAAMQQAAEVFGCDGLFHVLADGKPEDDAGIIAARDAGQIRWIELGPHLGWPEFRSLAEVDSESESGWFVSPDGTRWIPRVPASGRRLRQRVMESLERLQHIAERWDVLEQPPFRALAGLPEPDLAWLREPLRPADPRDQAWVAALPKVELHCHLGGFGTSGPLLDEVRAAAADPDLLPALLERSVPSGWPLPEIPIGLDRYMPLGDNNGSGLLKDPGCLRRQVELLYVNLVAQRVEYAEIRCSPGNYADPARGRSAWEVLSDIVATFNECRAAARARADNSAAPEVQLLIIATRRDGGDFRTGISRHLALAATAFEHWRASPGCRILGVDLAGYEERATRAHYFREDFTAVHWAGLAVTVHAGENDDAEAIWSAVFDLNARRIGHALHLISSPALLDAVSSRGIGIEMCPYANQQIVGFALGEGASAVSRDHSAAGFGAVYPLSEYLRRGIAVSVNTDNIGTSGAGLTDKLLLAARLCPGLRRLDLLQLIANGARTSFLSEPDRNRLAARLGRAAAETMLGVAQRGG